MKPNPWEFLKASRGPGIRFQVTSGNLGVKPNPMASRKCGIPEGFGFKGRDTFLPAAQAAPRIPGAIPAPACRCCRFGRALAQRQRGTRVHKSFLSLLCSGGGNASEGERGAGTQRPLPAEFGTAGPQLPKAPSERPQSAPGGGAGLNQCRNQGEQSRAEERGRASCCGGSRKGRQLLETLPVPGKTGHGERLPAWLGGLWGCRCREALPAFGMIRALECGGTGKTSQQLPASRRLLWSFLGNGFGDG